MVYGLFYFPTAPKKFAATVVVVHLENFSKPKHQFLCLSYRTSATTRLKHTSRSHSPNFTAARVFISSYGESQNKDPNKGYWEKLSKHVVEY